MGGKKIIFLFVALALPVFVFVFLKLFGKNEFDVPLLYDAGVTERPAGCTIDYGMPYLLPDSIYNSVNPRNDSLVAINFAETVPTKLQEIQVQFKQEKLSVHQASLLTGDRSYVKNCILLLKEPNTIVLIDNRKQIRGYYDGSDRDELDRLEAEIKILLKKY
jgi:hypothetical protein